jgi:hypothetical protein
MCGSGPPREKLAEASKGDVIFVLAGRESRKLYGLQLYSCGWAPALVLSVARFEVRRFAKLPLPQSVDLLSLAAPIDPPRRHFFACLSQTGISVERIRLGRFGTLSEVRALREWLDRRPEIHRLLVVSSRAHRLRVELCCRKLLPSSVQCVFLPVMPLSTNTVVNGEPGEEGSARDFLTEYGKLVLYRLVLLLERFAKQEAR